MTFDAALLGFLLGGFAGLAHLAMTWGRARAASRGHVALAMLTFPISIGASAGLLALAMRPSWAAGVTGLLGFWLARWPALAWVRRL